MNIKPFPYEFMARFGRDGQLQGYHVVVAQIACGDDGLPLKKENGENLLEQIGVATTLERAGLDLSQLLDTTLQGAIMSMDAARAETIVAVNAKATAEASLEQEKQAKVAVESELQQEKQARATSEAALKQECQARVQQEWQARVMAEAEREELRVQLQAALDQLAAK